MCRVRSEAAYHGDDDRPNEYSIDVKRGAESMRATRTSLATTLLAVVTALGNAAAVADDPSPETVLEGRGLKRSGMLYIVDQESDFVPQVAKLRPSFGQLKASFTKLAVVMQNQAEYDYLNDQWTLVNEQLRNVQADIDAHPVLSNNVLRQNWQNLLDAEKTLRYQYNELGREVNLRYRRLSSDDEKERLQGEFKKQREDFLEKSKELRARADRIKAEYDQLSKDDAVKKALDALKLSTKRGVGLGPSPTFKNASAWLNDAVRSTSPDSLRPRVNRKSVRNTTKDAPKTKGGPTKKANKSTGTKTAKSDEPDAHPG
jgi:hypothetical protein